MPKTVVIIEDDKDTAEIVRMYLARDGHRVLVANDGIRGLELARESSPDLVVLDLMLPGINGMQVCRELRDEADIAIVMLTARVGEEDRLAGLELGADDYVTKPFSPRELAARIRAVLRRTTQDPLGQGSLELSSGDVCVAVRDRNVRVGSETVPLTPTEFRLLVAFLREQGRTFTREQLIKRAFFDEFDGFDRTVDAHVSNLRRKIEVKGGPHRIETVYGVGYQWVFHE
jgi:two-component system alkaline phosphatase synthesis response regulator PhoP